MSEGHRLVKTEWVTGCGRGHTEACMTLGSVRLLKANVRDDGCRQLGQPASHVRAAGVLGARVSRQSWLITAVCVASAWFLLCQMQRHDQVECVMHVSHCKNTLQTAAGRSLGAVRLHVIVTGWAVLFQRVCVL